MEVITPKALHFVAQDRERSERTLGWGFEINLNPEGVAQFLSLGGSDELSTPRNCY